MGARENSVMVADAIAIAAAAMESGLKPLPVMTVTEWSDARRRLPSKGASEPGQWRTSRVPFLAEIMDCLGDNHPSKRVVFVKSAQVGGTECGLNWVGWHVDTRMAPMLCVQPTLEMAERWSKQRLATMVEDTPSLRSKIAPARSRDSGNTTLLKEYPGGVVLIAGANSASGLRSMPAGRIFLDEVDAYPYELEGEGDPIKLAEARAATFPRRKVFLVSTPTIESLSKIWKEWEKSDQRRYHVDCPHCGHSQVLEWENLRYPEGRPLEAVYHCSDCGVGIEEHHKTRMLEAGKWVAGHPERTVPGFHINALYTPIGLGLSWGELAAEAEDCKHDKAKWKTFENTKLGRVTKDPTEKLDPDELKSRATRYDLRTVPRGCLVLTAAVDVQKDRIEAMILGFGRESRMWVIDYTAHYGDPTESGVWDWLAQYLATPITNSFGIPVRITAAAVDAGFLQDDVLTFTQPRQRQGVIAVKGASTYGRPIVQKPTPVEYTPRGKVEKLGAQLWLVGADTAKSRIFHLLQADRKRTPGERRINFSDGLDDSFFSQLTAEIYDPNKRRWVKVRDRNEALDLMNYGMAAAYQPNLRVNSWKEPDWKVLEAMLEPEQDLFSTPAGQEKPAGIAIGSTRPRQGRRVRGAVT